MSSLNAKTYESAPSQHVAFIGLGVMGYPMAGHLARAGHAVTVYNRSATKAAACDISAACCGFVYALSVADAYVKAGFPDLEKLDLKQLLLWLLLT